MIENNYWLIGYLAALLTTFSLIPQIIRVCRLKESGDISLWTTSALSIGVLLWVVQGIVIGDLSAILLNGVSLVLSVLMVCRVIQYRCGGNIQMILQG